MADLTTLADGLTVNPTDRFYIMRNPTGVAADNYVTGAEIAELARDTLGAALIAGDGVVLTVNDAGDTITVGFNPTTSVKYQPQGTAETKFIQAIEMTSGLVATSALATDGSAGAKVWRLDAALNEDIVWVGTLPSWWLTWAIDVWWTNVGAGAGNVVFQPKHYEDVAHAGTNAGDGDNFAAPAAFVNTAAKTTVAAPALDIIKVTTVATGLARIADLTIINLTRLGSDAGDTMANDIGVIGLNLRRLT